MRQARESGRLNPRRSAPRRMRAAEGFDAILDRLEQAVAETRSMARTIRLASIPPEDWDPRFREPWLALLGRAAAAVSEADAEALDAVRADLDALAARARRSRSCRTASGPSPAPCSSTCATSWRRSTSSPTPSRCRPPPPAPRAPISVGR